uniref:Uncharacterized protein n=1 Tax=Ceratitis capitata TaxID=7213 RepID=W8B1J3_CERCA
MWFQDTWRVQVGWYEPIPTTIATQWLEHRSQLHRMADLKVSRWFGTGTTGSFTELHLFADASERAYAAVMYARTIHADGQIVVSIISSKTKVAPIKPTSLPRLELCAAHLAAKLARSVLYSWGNQRYPMFAWTDSTITLAWLQAHPSRWETFVANRVSEVHEVLPAECWNHVRSENNPADCASRGVTPLKLLHQEQWGNGPSFLRSSNAFWKSGSSKTHVTEFGLRKKVRAHLTHSDNHWSVMTKYSSYSKLKRVMAYVLRFVFNARSITLHNAEKRCGPVSSTEIAEAERRLIKYTQHFFYANEIFLCSAKRPIPLRSSLLRLQPFLDSNGILRIGGRLKSAKLAYESKHPAILHKNAPLSKLIVADIHRFTLHGGPQLMQVVLQRRYWVIGARNLIRNIYHKCVKCTYLNRNLATQAMGDLPASRFAYARCFFRTAVDFAGPYMYLRATFVLSFACALVQCI